MVLAFYRKAEKILKRDGRGVLMVVTLHKGSSPGRQGFHLLTTEADMTGTIGGGIMEHKLVELARSLLKTGRFDPFIKNQLHQPEAAKNRSGMICSGEQMISFFFLDKNDLDWVASLRSEKNTHLVYSNEGIEVVFNRVTIPYFNYQSSSNWAFKMPVELQSKAYVIGGGHVGLALCRVLSTLDFEIHLLDNRRELNTMEENQYAHSKKTVRYEEIEKHIPEGDNIFVIIISFGYRTDKVIVKRLLSRKYFYLGMMGSQNKIDILWKELQDEGYKEEDLDRIVAPIGLDIKSETTHEIAVSIAAQLILWKNKKRQE